MRSHLLATLDVLSGTVRVLEFRRMAPRSQPAFDGDAQSLASVASVALLAARARFALSAAPDNWAPAAVREIDNAAVTRGRSVDSIVHPLFPLAIVL